MGKVEKVTSEHFEELVLQSDKPVVVIFYMDRSPHFKRLEPTLDKLADQFATHIKFLAVNFETEPALATRYGITTIPTLSLFRNGRCDYAYQGFLLPQAVEAQLKHLAQLTEAELVGYEV